MTDAITFRDLDGGIHLHGDSALDLWYHKVRDVPVEELSDGDLSRACRQNLFRDQLVPIALSRLRSNPAAGDLYNGELLVSLGSIEGVYWEVSPRIAAEFVEILQAFDIEICGDEVAKAIATLKERIQRGRR